MTGYGNAPNRNDFSALEGRYKNAVAALGGTNRDWAISELNALKNEFAQCEGDQEHGEQAKNYTNEIAKKLSE